MSRPTERNFHPADQATAAEVAAMKPQHNLDATNTVGRLLPFARMDAKVPKSWRRSDGIEFRSADGVLWERYWLPAEEGEVGVWGAFSGFPTTLGRRDFHGLRAYLSAIECVPADDIVNANGEAVTFAADRCDEAPVLEPTVMTTVEESSATEG